MAAAKNAIASAAGSRSDSDKKQETIQEIEKTAQRLLESRDQVMPAACRPCVGTWAQMRARTHQQTLPPLAVRVRATCARASCVLSARMCAPSLAAG